MTFSEIWGYIKMKKLFMLGLMLIFMFGASFSNIASDQNNVEKLIEIIKSGKVNLWVDRNEKVLYIYENTGKHDHFETTYKKHYVTLKKGADNSEWLVIGLRDYQDYYTIHNARGFILVILVDYNNDGKIDTWRKDYIIALDAYHILSPFYPPGYINKDWFKMSREEAQKIFDKELNYILENIDKAKS